MLFKWAGFQKFAIWVSLLDGGTAPTPGPPPPTSNSFILLADGSSYLLLTDGASKLQRVE